MLDAKTILYSLVVAELTASAVLCFLFFFGRHRGKAGNLSLGLWSAAFFLGALGTLLLTFRGILPDSLTLVVANFLILFGTGLRRSGVAAFFARPLAIWVAVLAGGGWLALCLVPGFSDTLAYRAGYTQPVMIGLIVWSALICQRHDRDNLITPRIYAFSAWLEAVAHVSLLLCLTYAGSDDLFAALRGIVVPVTLMVILVCMVLSSFTSLAMPIERSLQQFKFDAYRDSLTGLSNRRAVYEDAADLKAALGADALLTVIRFDIDDFKRVNDTYGHAIGDTVLRVFGDVCRQTLPAALIAGRLGGDEFAIIGGSLEQRAAEAMAERIKDRFAVACLKATHGAVYVSLSAGISLVRSADGLDHALEVADKAAYQAKRQGPANTVVIAPYSTRRQPVSGRFRSSPLGPQLA